MEDRLPRKLAAILYADVAGYSRLSGQDEDATHRALGEYLDFISTTIESHQGQVMHYAGDAVLAKFAAVVDAISAAVAIQSELRTRNQDLPDDRKVQFRIGVNLGDVIEDRDDIYGDGVNIAARLESLAPPGGVCITGQVAEQIHGKVDVAFGNAGRHNFKNIARPIEVWCWPAENARTLRRAATVWWRFASVGAVAGLAAAAAIYLLLTQEEKSSLPTGPKIAVIPFDEVTEKPDDTYFSDGLTKDINAYLSKFTNLFVFAPSSVSGFRGNADCETIRSELGADYILEGGVRRSGDRLRVTTTLTDAKACRQLDSPGPYNRDLSVADVLDIQLEIAQKVTASVGSADAPLFNASVQNAIRHKAPDSLQAYDCVLLSYWFYENFDPGRHRRARACLEKAIELDVDYSLGWSRLAFSYIESKKYAIDTPSDWAEQARATADRAISLDPDNPDAYYALAILTQMTTQDLPQYRNFAQRAIALNPNDAFVLADLGTWMGYAGQWEIAKEWVSRAMQLNPKHQSWL